MERSEQLFIKGFNNGYLLAKHEPALLTSMLNNIQPLTNYINGIKSGKLAFELKFAQDRLSELNELKDKKSPDLERD